MPELPNFLLTSASATPKMGSTFYGLTIHLLHALPLHRRSMLMFSPPLLLNSGTAISATLISIVMPYDVSPSCRWCPNSLYSFRNHLQKLYPCQAPSNLDSTNLLDCYHSSTQTRPFQCLWSFTGSIQDGCSLDSHPH